MVFLIKKAKSLNISIFLPIMNDESIPNTTSFLKMSRWELSAYWEEWSWVMQNAKGVAMIHESWGPSLKFLMQNETS